MVHKTKGIVLRGVKYGETSLIVTALTELFGLQSYIVNGVRTASKKGGARANHFQPAALLDMVVYKNEFNNLQRIREFSWAYLYRHIFSDVRKNAVAQFMVELLNKCLKEPEHNPDLFYFIEDAFLHLDEADDTITANYPLFFSLHLAVFFGFRIADEYSDTQPYLDLQEGVFVGEPPRHAHFVEGRLAEVTSHVLKILQPHDLAGLHLTGEFRRNLLSAYETYYALHLPDFGHLRTLPILREVLS